MSTAILQLSPNYPENADADPPVANLAEWRAAPDWLDDQSVATLLRLRTPRTVATWRKTRGLPHVVLGSRFVRISKRDLEAWLAQYRRAVTRIED